MRGSDGAIHFLRSALLVSFTLKPFLQVPDAKLKYQQLLYLGKKLPALPASQHSDDNKVRGCVSQV